MSEKLTLVTDNKEPLYLCRVVEFKVGIDETPEAPEGNFYAYLDGYCTEHKGIKYPMLQAEKYLNTKDEAETWLATMIKAYHN